ncbi:MAG: hypothetical protein IKG93_02460 [Clostridiales bacterium]|nr:hypothetical protein [Clostridiales bacterium]
MDKAFLCPRCGAQVLLSEAADNVCCFCSLSLKDENAVKDVDWGFHTPGYLTPPKVIAVSCEDCEKLMFVPKQSSMELHTCVNCGSPSLKQKNLPVKLPKGIKVIPFKYSREEAVESYLQSVKKEGWHMHQCKGKAFLESITPVYIPCFLYDYNVGCHAVISVVPIIKNTHRGESFFNLLTASDLTLEYTSSTVEPYPKNFVAEMIWENLPIPACTAIDKEQFEKISPFSIKSGIYEDMEPLREDGCFLPVDRPWDEINENLTSTVRAWVKEFVLSESMEHYKVSSYVDNSSYEKGLGQLAYFPVWIMKNKKKEDLYCWFMNGLTGSPSDLKLVSTAASETRVEQNSPTSLASLNKKKIRNFKQTDLANTGNPLNCRTYMVDTVSSSIMLESQLNESASDKSLFRLERSFRKNDINLSVPVAEAYEEELDEEMKELASTPIPSAPVPLPEQHSPLYMMKQEIQDRRLGRGERLPQKPVDRDVGIHSDSVYDDITREERAVEEGLADLPEFDPSGPSPFQKNIDSEKKE